MKLHSHSQVDENQGHPASMLSRGQRRILSKAPREIPAIVAVTRKRSDVASFGRFKPRLVTISLARVSGFFEEETGNG
jgi:hypothetical protein